MLVPVEPITHRVIGFMQHLRVNNFVVGPAETQTALSVLTRTDIKDRDAVRIGLKTLLTGRHEEWIRFDVLFEAYWSKRGRVRQRLEGAGQQSDRHPEIWTDHLPGEKTTASLAGVEDSARGVMGRECGKAIGSERRTSSRMNAE